ncbi:MAG: VapC toxin family PIN domain ribonuclease [Syntrophus sp. (in: bacteria)]|nr:VapC toxin family PIN domain ribonuclease [Syntrophus sp. (in: bacteria)]
MILVDTSVLIDFFKGLKNDGTVKFEAILQHGIPFGINSFIFQEVLQGASSDKEFLLLVKYLATQRFYHLKDPVNSFSRAARLYMECRKHGITVRSTIDCLIAETALEYDLALLHNDNDFIGISKIIPLKVY